MNYAFAPSESRPDLIVLRSSRAVPLVLSIILMIIGAAVLPFGLILFFGDAGHYPPFLVTGIGLLLLSAGILVGTRMKIPRRLVFDNGRGALIIREGKREAPDPPSISYDAIDSFQVRRHRSGKSDAYAAEMIKKDGAFWALFVSRDRERADRFCAALRDSVDLSAAPAPARAAAPRQVRVTNPGDPFVMEWKNAYGAGNYLLTFLLIGAMWMLIYGSRPYATSIAVYWIALGFISFIALFAVASTLNIIGRVHRVEIGRGMMTYRKKGGLVRAGEFSIPVMDIDAILFNFAPSAAESVIYVLTRAEKDAFLDFKRGLGDLSEIARAIDIMRKTRKIDVGPLGIGDRIDLEGLLQNAVAGATGIQNSSL